MNEEDLRDCFAMFAMMGMVGREVSDVKWMSSYAENAYKMADHMLEARSKKYWVNKEIENEEDDGIAAVVPKRTRKR